LAGKNNPLRELFISIGLVGAKKATKELDKLTKAEEDLAKTVKMSNKDLDKQEEKLDDVGDEAIRTSKKVGKLKRAISGMAIPLKGLLIPLKAMLIPLRAIFGFFTGILRVAGGVLLSQAVSSITSAFGGLLSVGVRDASAEQDAVLELQRGMFLQNKYTLAIDKRLQAVAAAIQRTLGISADETLSGLGKLFASGVDPRSGARLANIAAPFAELGGKEIGEILEAIGKTQATGALEEVLSVTMPLLRTLTEEQLKSNVLLDTMAKGIENFSGFKDTTLTKAMRTFKASFSEWVKIFGRPVARGIKGLLNFFTVRMNEFMKEFKDSAGFGKTGKMIARFLNSVVALFQTSDTPKLIKEMDEILSALVRTLGRVVIDFGRFFKGEESLIGKFLKAAGLEQTLGGLIKFFLQELFSLLIGAFVGALGGSTMALARDVTVPKNSPLDKFLDFASTVPQIRQYLDLLDLLGTGVKSATKYLLTAPPPPTEGGNAKPNPNDSSSISIIQDIKITSENPAKVINQMLDASLSKYGNLGRIV